MTIADHQMTLRAKQHRKVSKVLIEEDRKSGEPIDFQFTNNGLTLRPQKK